MDDTLENIAIILGSATIGGVISTASAFLAETMVESTLLGWRTLGVVGTIIGGVMGFCSVAKIEGLGSHMTDQLVLGTTVYRYRHRIIKENYSDYVFFFAAFALFVVNLWAYNPAFDSGTFSSDILCLSLAFGGVTIMSLLNMKLPNLISEARS